MTTLFKFKPLSVCLPFMLGLLLATPALAAKGKPDSFGSTGILGDMHPAWPKKPAAIKVAKCETGSPADGKLNAGDIIVGIGSGKFTIDPRPAMAFAIDDAEVSGKLTLLLETGKQVVIEMPALGAYSPTAPYKCPKTEKIIRDALDGVLAKKEIGGSATRADLLGLMATGEKTHIDRVGELIKERGLLEIEQSYVEAIISGEQPDTRLYTAGWAWGYNLITLGEYYLLTKDESVLPAMRSYAWGLARGQDASGCWGHRMMTRKSGGRLPGYAQMNQPSISNFMGMIIARKCGIKDPVLDQAIDRSYAYVADHVDKGGFPYGVGGPVPGTFNNNGMSGAAAICMSLLGNQHGAKYFSQNAATSYGSLTTGHASAFFNPLWTPLGASLSGPEVTRQFFRKSMWYFNSKRHWAGGFPGDDGRAGPYSGQALLTYCLPRKALLITGREADPSIWVKADEATEVIMRSKLADESKSTEDLLKLLDHPSPQVPAHVARILMERTRIYRRDKKKDDITPKIMAIIENGKPRQRANAMACFGSNYQPEFIAPHLEKIGAILRDTKEQFQVRLEAALAIASGCFGDASRAYYNDVLELMFAERPDINDPFGHIDTQLAQALNGICTEPYAANLVTDKDLFLKASSRLLAHKRQKARFTGIKMLRGIPHEDFPLIGGKLMVAIENKDPSFQSYHNMQDTVAPGVEVLARLNIKDGLDVLLKHIMSGGGKWGFKSKMLYYALPLYGGNALPYVPKFEEHPNIAKNKDQGSWKKLVDTLKADKDPAKLISLAEAMRAGKPE